MAKNKKLTLKEILGNPDRKYSIAELDEVPELRPNRLLAEVNAGVYNLATRLADLQSRFSNLAKHISSFVKKY